MTNRYISDRIFLRSYLMSEDTRSELKRPRPDTLPSTIVSPNSKSPQNKKLNFKMPPKPKIIRTKLNLTGAGDSVLKALHHQHFDNFEANLRAPPVYESKATKILHETYCKIHEVIEK